jgi:hypothetical protein
VAQVSDNTDESAVALLKRDELLARVHALRVDGVPWRRIGKLLGCDHADLWRDYRLAGLSTAKDSRERLERLQGRAYDIAEDALDYAAEELPNLKGFQKIIAAGIFTDKVSSLAKVIQGDGGSDRDSLGAMLSKLVDSGGGTITVEPHRTLDITPAKEDSE